MKNFRFLGGNSFKENCEICQFLVFGLEYECQLVFFNDGDGF